MKTVITNHDDLISHVERFSRKWGWELPLSVELKAAESTRSYQQNAKMWAMLTQLAHRATWYGEQLAAEGWKDLISAGLIKEQKTVQGIGGGLVYLGSRTSRMTVPEMQELIEFMNWFVNEKPDGLCFDGFIFVE